MLPRLSVISRGAHCCELRRLHGGPLATVEHDGQLVLSLRTRGSVLTLRGRPEIFNTDRDSQFTSAAFTGALAAAGIRISMDGRSRQMDNVFIERLWRSLKHEDVYFKGYADGREAHASIASWIAFYNAARPHYQALGNRMPLAVWRQGATAAAAGAKAVDMTLRLDNAGALPTCPQSQHQQ